MMFAAFAVAAAQGLSLVQQCTAATLVALALSLCVLILLALPLTWRRVVLIASVVAAFVLLFPVHAPRSFYALDLPRHALAATLLIAALGAVGLVTFWALFGRRGLGRSGAG